MADTPGFGSFVPGFDFLQGLVKNAGAALPGIGQWVAPTLDPKELEKRISELRTVQFWLEQNASMLGATIQALEVQRMTLSTLQTMNVQMGDLRESLKIKMPAPSPEPAPERSPAPSAWGAPAPRPEAAPAVAAAPAEASPAEPGSNAPAAPAVDPLQWWGALTQQFAQLATSAMKNSPSEGGNTVAGAMLKRNLDAATASKKPPPGKTARKTTSKRAATAKGATGA